MIILMGCASTGSRAYAPVTDINRAPAKHSGEHRVESGETLYSIAWRYNRDFTELARINGIKSPYHLKRGQTIYLAADDRAKAKATQKIPAKSKSYATQETPAESSSSRKMESGLTWHWPTAGKIIQHFSSKNEQKGIDLAGRKGQPILAAAAGEVVYSGDGLRGYGKLIIIKHNDEYLSAYAHNSKLMVSEGERVKASQQIAEMGQTDAASAKLHFEIRKHGNPVDPLQYLPKQN